MTQFLNNIWQALSTENPVFIEHFSIFLIPFENYIMMSLFLITLNIHSTRNQRISYVVCMTILSILTSNFLISPLNVIINYVGIFILIKIIFKLDLLKALISLLVSIFIFGLCNILLQNPYMTILHISPDVFITTPIYRISYVLILYLFLFVVCIFLTKLKKIKFTLDLIDTLDKKTKTILLINLIAGFLTLCIQLIITAFYIEIVPIIITVLSSLLLITFLLLSIYSFSRIVKLSITKRDLQNAEDYNKSLEIMYDKVKGFKHDFENIIYSLDGYLDNNDLIGAKKYFNEVKKDCKITSNLSILNPRIVNNPCIYSLLNNMYSKASKLGIDINIKFFLDLSDLKINIYEFSRILGVLLNNAIDASSLCDEKIIKIIFRREENLNKSVVVIENTYNNKDIDLSEIFKKGYSEKENHSGIGLWEVKKYINNSPNLNLITTKNDKFFTQKLEIYDEITNLL